MFYLRSPVVEDDLGVQDRAELAEQDNISVVFGLVDHIPSVLVVLDVVFGQPHFLD